MVDYGEEQRNELEALDSIYPTEMNILENDPISLEVFVTPEMDSSSSDNSSACCVLSVTLPATYPDVSPEYTVKSRFGVNAARCKQLEEELRQHCEENLGMVVIFTLVSHIQERLHEWYGNGPIEDYEQEPASSGNANQSEKSELLHGTAVTKENFEEWNAGFIKEFRQRAADELRARNALYEGRKTGKEIWLNRKQSVRPEDIDWDVFEAGSDEEGLGKLEDLGDIELDEDELEELSEVANA